MLGSATSNADCSHDGFRARTEHTEHFASRHQLVDLLCKQEFSFVEKTGYGAASVEEFENFFFDRREVAAQNGGAARLKEVDILVAVAVVQICAFSLLHAHGEREVEREVVLNAAGNILLCLGRDFFGLCALGVEMIENVFESVLGYAIDRLIRQIFQFFIDLLCILPFGNTIAVCHNSPPEIFGINLIIPNVKLIVNMQNGGINDTKERLCQIRNKKAQSSKSANIDDFQTTDKFSISMFCQTEKAVKVQNRPTKSSATQKQVFQESTVH